MDLKKSSSDFARLMGRWLNRNRLGLLLGSIIFFLIMYVNILGLKLTQVDQAFGTVVLGIGLINFTFWTLMNKPVPPQEEKKRIKGKRKS